MSAYIRIPSEPVYTIELDDEDDSEYNVPHWSNGVKCDDTTCASCGTKCGPYTTTEPSGQLDIYGHAIMQPVINWIPVYHRTLTYLDNQRPLLCRECVENEWWKYHENLHLTAEYMCGDVVNIVDMLEKPWKYVDEWWAAFGAEQDEFFNTEQVPT